MSTSWLWPKATPQEAEAFRRWMVAAAQAAADAAKEGGFMGFGAEQVSAGEKQMLDHVSRSGWHQPPSAVLLPMVACLH